MDHSLHIFIITINFTITCPPSAAPSVSHLRYGDFWHCVVGRNFGCFATHETRMFLYFYIDDKAVMIYKAG